VRLARAALVLALLAACATPAAPGGRSGSFRAADFAPGQIRQPAVFVRVVPGGGPWTERERSRLVAAYEGALLEALNARAVATRDIRSGPEAPDDGPAALARARQVGADHAVLVTVRVDRGFRRFCLDGRRPFETTATLWRQQARVLRASDGAERLRVEPEVLTVSDLEPDCEDPRASRRRSLDETAADAVSRLLGRLLGSSS
jgi:hypothetical protein